MPCTYPLCDSANSNLRHADASVPYCVPGPDRLPSPLLRMVSSCGFQQAGRDGFLRLCIPVTTWAKTPRLPVRFPDHASCETKRTGTWDNHLLSCGLSAVQGIHSAATPFAHRSCCHTPA